jgi:hypothetical protein
MKTQKESMNMLRRRSPHLLRVILAPVTFTISLAAIAVQSTRPASPLDYAKIECETIVNGSLAEAWACWSTSEGAQSFFAPKCRIEPQPGGAFEIWFNPADAPGERGAEDLHVLSVLPGEMISFEWNAPPQFTHARPQRTWVVVTFNAVDDQHTRVRLVHLGWDEMKAKNPDHMKEWDEVKAYFERAWPKVLGWMKQRFEQGPRWDAQGNSLWKE